MAERKRIDQEVLVDAALALTRREGFDALTMRALAAELGVTTMAAYHWVPSKQAVVDLVLDSLLTELRRDVPAGPWRERLRAQAMGYLRIVREHPGVEATFRDHSITAVERSMIREERAALKAAGFSEPVLTYAWDLYQSFMFGHFALETQRGRSRSRDSAAFAWGLDQVLDAMERAATAA